MNKELSFVLTMLILGITLTASSYYNYEAETNCIKQSDKTASAIKECKQ